jgi:hypothetical protein
MQRDMDGLDREYEILAALAAHPELDLPVPLNLTGGPNFSPLDGLYERCGSGTFYMHLCHLEEYGFVGRLRSPCRYAVTTEGHDFLARVEARGGWDGVRTAAVERPVRLTMGEICRWSQSWA